MLIDFVGITVEAKEVTWFELGTRNDFRYMRDSNCYLYLGNYYGVGSTQDIYALFTDPEKANKYCVKLPPSNEYYQEENHEENLLCNHP